MIAKWEMRILGLYWPPPFRRDCIWMYNTQMPGIKIAHPVSDNARNGKHSRRQWFIFAIKYVPSWLCWSGSRVITNLIMHYSALHKRSYHHSYLLDNCPWLTLWADSKIIKTMYVSVTQCLRTFDLITQGTGKRNGCFFIIDALLTSTSIYLSKGL